MDKVASSNVDDACKFEFNFAVVKKGKAKIIPIVMEPEVCNAKEWYGMIEFELSDVPCVDLSDFQSVKSTAFHTLLCC